MSEFYTTSPTDSLRLGDVVSGFTLVTPKSSRLVESEDMPRDFVIAVHEPRYLVVMTPCCSIEDGAVVLAPLSRVRHAFFRNPYFEEDLTRINRKVAPKDSMPSHGWERLKPEQKTARLNEDPGYVFLDCFIYQPHSLLARYHLRKEKMEWETGHYMVDFKAMYRFECALIRRENQVAPVPEGCRKLLQLTAMARKELRDKLTYFFSRPAEEDLRELR
jgi:hypothetical protein